MDMLYIDKFLHTPVLFSQPIKSHLLFFNTKKHFAWLHLRNDHPETTLTYFFGKDIGSDRGHLSLF